VDERQWGVFATRQFRILARISRGICDGYKKKMPTQYDFDVDEIQDDFKVAMFIDSTMIRSERPGRGPIVPGPFAPRYPFIGQEAFYNGWKRFHGIKKQSIGLANGMAFHVSRGYSCRRHDLYVLNVSGILPKMIIRMISSPAMATQLTQSHGALPAEEMASNFQT
jgi:hypothetical protein